MVNRCNASSLPTFQGIENQDPLFFLLVLSPKDGARARKKWVKMRALPWAIALRRVAAEVIATILPSHGQSPDLVASGSVVCLRF